MRRLAAFAVVMAFASWGCSDKTPTSPNALRPTFTATLSPANEVPPITNAESGGRGDVTITLDVTKDAAGNITSAKANFLVNVSNFPTGTSFTAMHIHEGATTCACPVVINAGLSAAEGFGATGSARIEKNGITVSPVELAQRLINNPSAFYFNIHSTLNGGGVARGQLTKTSG